MKRWSMNQVDLLEDVIYNIFYLSVSSLWRTCIMKYFVTAMCANCPKLCNENTLCSRILWCLLNFRVLEYYNSTSNSFGLTKSKLKTVFTLELKILDLSKNKITTSNVFRKWNKTIWEVWNTYVDDFVSFEMLISSKEDTHSTFLT